MGGFEDGKDGFGRRSSDPGYVSDWWHGHRDRLNAGSDPAPASIPGGSAEPFPPPTGPSPVRGGGGAPSFRVPHVSERETQTAGGKEQRQRVLVMFAAALFAPLLGWLIDRSAGETLLAWAGAVLLVRWFAWAELLLTFAVLCVWTVLVTGILTLAFGAFLPEIAMELGGLLLGLLSAFRVYERLPERPPFRRWLGRTALLLRLGGNPPLEGPDFETEERPRRAPKSTSRAVATPPIDWRPVGGGAGPPATGRPASARAPVFRARRDRRD